jgi:hypothetical protein
MKCKLCGNEFDELINPNFQQLVQKIQNKQYEIEKLYEQVTSAYVYSKNFKDHISRERDIYGNINEWFNSILREFNIPKKKNGQVVHYSVPALCGFNPNKICDLCLACKQ